MEIVVTGRNVEVPEHFRVHVTEKVERLERYDHKIVGLEVELFHERNRRQLKNCQRVEITGRGCGPVARWFRPGSRMPLHWVIAWRGEDRTRIPTFFQTTRTPGSQQPKRGGGASRVESAPATSDQWTTRRWGLSS